LLGLPLHWAARQLHRSGPHAAAAAPRLVRWQRAQALRRARRLVPRPAQAHVRWRCSPHCRRPRPCRSGCAAAARAPAAPARPLARPPRVLLAHARARAQVARQVLLRAARRWWGRGPRQKRRGQGSSLAPDQPGTAARRRPHHQPRLRPALRDALCACVCRRAPRQSPAGRAPNIKEYASLGAHKRGAAPAAPGVLGLWLRRTHRTRRRARCADGVRHRAPGRAQPPTAASVCPRSLAARPAATRKSAEAC